MNPSRLSRTSFVDPHSTSSTVRTHLLLNILPFQGEPKYLGMRAASQGLA